MSVRRSRPYRIVLWVATITCVLGAGYLAYATFFAAPSAAKLSKTADATYARGLEAYNQKNWGEAAARFDEAKIQADKANTALEALKKDGKTPPDEVYQLEGRIMWVKARAIRDHAYAQAQIDGKALPDLPDPQYNNETYRAFAALTDPKAKEEAFGALRIAEQRLGSEPEVLKEGLRFELVVTPIQWHMAEPLLRKSLELNKDDARANYYLARYEYEQPTNGVPIPLDRRSAERMEKARELVAAARRSKPPAPYWRTTGLEADILDWPLRTAAARKLKPDAIAGAEKTLDQLLFDPQTGAVAALGQADKLTGLGVADVLGLVSTLNTAFERAAADARRPGGSPERLKQVTRAGLDLANALVESEPLKVHLAQVVPTVLQIAAGAQPTLAKLDKDAWSKYVAGLDALVAKSPEAVRQNPRVYLALAQVATTDAALEPGRAKELLAGAVKYLEDGLKAAAAAKSPPAVTDELHAELAARLLQTGARVEQIEPHVAPLRTSVHPQLKLQGQLFDALAAERQGRLDKARKLLVAVAADPTNPGLAFQAKVLQANVAIVTGDWPAALGALKDVSAKYKAAELPASARAWADEHLGGLDGVTARLIEANLNTAMQVATRYLRENPGKTVPVDLVAGYESAAEALLKTVKSQTPAERAGRLAQARFVFATGRVKAAADLLDGLAKDYPDSIEVLRARCEAAVAVAGVSGAGSNGPLAADAIILKFIKDYKDGPVGRAGRLFYAEWLLRTNRAEDAATYLRDSANFPGGRDAVVERLLAAALLQQGKREEAQDKLRALAPDPIIDAVLIQAAAGVAAAEKQLKEALGRYENQGLFRIYEAALRLGEGKYEEAVRGFASAAEFTQFAGTARAGMRRALLAYAEAEPAKARELAVRLAADLPDEPGVYLGAAAAAAQMDDIGAPADKWAQTKTLYAAANRWEEAALKAGVAPADLVLMKAQFHLIAGDVAAAKQEAATGLARNDKHVPLMLALAELYLVAPADTGRAREYLGAAQKVNAADPRLPLLEAAIRTASGNPAGAAEVYAGLVADQPRNGAVRALLVAALTAADKKDEALTQARAWAETLPEDNRAVTAVIQLLAGSNQRDKAVPVADALVTRRAAEARKRAEDMKPALTAAEVDKFTTEARAVALLSAATGFFRAGAYPDAEVRAEEVLKEFPKATRVKLMLGDIAVARKDWDKAIPLYRKMLDESPRNFIAGNNLAWILAAQKNDPAEALKIVEEVRKARDGNRPVGPERLPADFLDTLGVIYTHPKLNQPARYPEMRATFEVAVRRYPADPRMWLYLGHAQAATGERSKALESYSDAEQRAKAKNSLPDDQNKAVLAAVEDARKKLNK